MELLHKLYSIHSMSGQEGAMRKYVKSYVKSLDGDITLRQDQGNIYITKGEAESYPCLVAHLDQVQTRHSSDFRSVEMDGSIFGYSRMNRRQEGLGADDKNGIWIALKCLEQFPVLKVALFKEEEIGCRGSSVADMSFFGDCRYCIQADRKHGGDLITEIGGTRICSDAFLLAIEPFMTAHGYTQTHGMMTDVKTLVDNGVGISCINMSCGYYDPHTDGETTDVAELYNALSFVQDIVRSLTDTYPHNPPRQSYGRGWYGGWWKGLSREHYSRPEAFIPERGDYPNTETWLEDLVMYNEDYSADEIWQYVSADCETDGWGYEDFLGYYDYCLECYYGLQGDDPYVTSEMAF